MNKFEGMITLNFHNSCAILQSLLQYLYVVLRQEYHANMLFDFVSSFFSCSTYVLIKQLGMPPKLKEKVELWGEVKTNL